MKRINAVGLFIFFIVAFSVKPSHAIDVSLDAMKILKWEELAPGVWSAVIGAEPETTYLDFAGALPRTSVLEELPPSEFPFEEARGLIHQNRAIVRMPLGPDEKLYGLGLQFQGMNRRGRVYHLRTDHYSRGNDRLHAPTPFYISSAGYGVLFNSPLYIDIYAGIGNRKDSPGFPTVRDRNTDSAWAAQPKSDAVEASVYADGMEVLVFTGPTMLDVVKRYNLYFGGGALPPKWGLGFWHRMRTLADSDEVLAEVDEFKRRGFPIDVIGLEPGWHTRAYPCTFEWSDERFPNPQDFLNEMSERGVKVNLWENPYVSPEAGIYEAIKPFTGSHTVWLGIVPDFMTDQAREIFTRQHEREHLSIGVSGYKFDEVDGYDRWLWPDLALFPSGTSAEQMRQTYALQIQQMMMNVFRGRNQRTYSLIRANNAGSSAYPFAIYTDHYDHRGFVTALVNSGFGGLLYTPEIRSADSGEEWVRRMQSVCFSHMVQLNGWSSNTKPWSFPEVEEIIRDTIQLRVRLLPYIYTAFAKYHFEGIPPIRPMVLEPGYMDEETIERQELDDTANPYAEAVRRDVTDQYMFGDSILVAPIFAGETSRTVILPKGKWFDFYTGDYAGGGEVITVSPSLDRIPLYVRDGGIIPMLKDAQTISLMTGPVDIELRHYGESPSNAVLYDDEGESFDYEDGEFCWIELEVNKKRNGEFTGSHSKDGKAYASQYAGFEWRFMTD